MADTMEQLAEGVAQSAPNEFTTQVHVADKQGQPEYNKDGTYKKKRKGQQTSQVEIVDTPTARPAYDEMGKVMATTLTSSFTMLLGSEWKPDSGEYDAMSMAWAKYFESTGMQEFPPWLMLAMVHTGYVGKRLYQPETRSRLRMIYDGIRNKFGRRKYYARSDSGYDVQRQDNSSNQSFENIQA